MFETANDQRYGPNEHPGYLKPRHELSRNVEQSYLRIRSAGRLFPKSMPMSFMLTRWMSLQCIVTRVSYWPQISMEEFPPWRAKDRGYTHWCHDKVCANYIVTLENGLSCRACQLFATTVTAATAATADTTRLVLPRVHDGEMRL